MAEIEDENEEKGQKDNVRDEKKRMKEKLILLFSDYKAGKILSKTEIFAIVEYLQRYVKPFIA
jgi:hypothetical protein